MTTRVKICGLTQPDQAAAVAQCGADAVGLVFAKSKRQVTPEQAAEITAVLPPGLAVGVFVDSPVAEIRRIAEIARLACVQLHGGEPSETVATLGLPCIKAFAVRDEHWLSQVKTWLAGVPTELRDARSGGLVGILLDTYSPHAAGGTGEAFNWELVARYRQAGDLDDLPPMLLAGGLNPQNVVAAIEIVQPWGVDVSGGVEAAAGVKDLEKVRSFIQIAKHAIDSLES